MKLKKDESGIGVPVTSRSKKKDSPKGGKTSGLMALHSFLGSESGKAVISGVHTASSQGLAAQKSEDEKRQARLAKQKESILRGK